MTESNLNLSQGSDDMPFSAQNIEQALDILSAEAGNLSDTQNQETALANVNLLRDLMRQTGVVAPMMANQGASLIEPTDFQTLEFNEAERGIAVAKQVQDIGFVEFTAGLINGTFDAIIGATIKQMEAYTKLVADIAKTLKDFQAENVSDAQINAHLLNRYPDGEDGTSIKFGYAFKETTDAVTGVATTAETRRTAVADALIVETAGLGEKKLIVPVLSLTVKDSEVASIRAAIGLMLASNMKNQLQAMAREGMARIVITEGSIRTKLTFKVDTTETYIKHASQYRANSRGGSVSGYYAGKKWGVSGGFANSRINISTINETNYNNLTTSAEIIGEVNIKFKTETFPPYEPPIVKTPASTT